MSTTSKNTILKSVRPGWVFPDIKSLLDSTISFNQGDLVYLDTTNHLVKALDSDAHAATLLGVSTEKVVSGKVSRPYSTDVDASQAAGAIQGPTFGVTAKLILKTGDALSPGQKVYFDTDAQHCTSTAGTNALGVYQGPAIASAAAGQEIEVLINANYPAAGLV